CPGGGGAVRVGSAAGRVGSGWRNGSGGAQTAAGSGETRARSGRSEADSDSGDEEDLGSERRGVKRGLSDLELGGGGQEAGAVAAGFGAVTGGVVGAKPGKKTRGRVKIKMEFIDNKLRRYTTFSKRKTGIMKKAYELSTLTGTQVLLLVASETGHVYTFATRKLQPMITSETGKALIQTCLNSPDSPPRSDPTMDQRMSATGFEETDLTYQVSECDSSGENKDTLKPAFTVTNLPGTTTSSNQTSATTSTTMQVSSGATFPITNYLPPTSGTASPCVATSANGTVLKTSSAVASGSVMQLPSFTLMPGESSPPGTPFIVEGQQRPLGTSLLQFATQLKLGGGGLLPAKRKHLHVSPAASPAPGGAMAQQVPVQTIQVHQPSQQNSSSSDSGTEITQTSTSGAVTLPATIMTSSVPTSMAGHMMYPSPHAVMYASTPGLTDGGLAVLNAFSQAPSAMQVSHGQVQDQGGVPQVFLTAPPGTVQIPVSAVQLHQMAVIGQQSSGGANLTELQVVNLDTAHSS
uniref:Serum response factor n=1 Tax=Latimeria chalumnae TaxID=7897 RepID=H3B378_LATCH